MACAIRVIIKKEKAGVKFGSSELYAYCICVCNYIVLHSHAPLACSQQKIIIINKNKKGQSVKAKGKDRQKKKGGVEDEIGFDKKRKGLCKVIFPLPPLLPSPSVLFFFLLTCINWVVPVVVMIIKSRLTRSSSIYRQTRISDPLSTSFESVVETLLKQWNLFSSYNTLHTSNCAFLIFTGTNAEEKLIIDQQVEWQLFCEEHVSLQQEIVVDLELAHRSSLLDNFG